MADAGGRPQGPALEEAALLQQQGECRGLSSAPAGPPALVVGAARAHRRCWPPLTPRRGR